MSCFGSVENKKKQLDSRTKCTVDTTTARSEGSDAFSSLFKTALSPTMPWPLLDKKYGDRRGEHSSVYFHPFSCLVRSFFDRTRFGGKPSPRRLLEPVLRLPLSKGTPLLPVLVRLLAPVHRTCTAFKYIYPSRGDVTLKLQYIRGSPPCAKQNFDVKCFVELLYRTTA